MRISAPWLLLAPFALLFVGLYVAPIAWSLRESLFADRLIGGETFVGMEAYGRALKDSSFLHGFGNVAVLSAVQIPISLALALVLALILDGKALRARGLFRVGIFLPYAVPTVVAGLMWGFMYDPDLGPLAQMAGAVGLTPPDFLSAHWMLASIGNIVTWGGTGIAMVILYTALKAIPTDLEEAAAVDGASAADVVRTIKIPLLRPALGLLLLLSVIAMLQLFGEPAVLRELAPQVIGNDFTPNLYAYAVAFRSSDLNYAATLAFVLTGIVMLVSYGGMALGRLRRSA
ncbi:MAG: carbohydrate ABC transporter permease [Conexibacter sp.]